MPDSDSGVASPEIETKDDTNSKTNNEEEKIVAIPSNPVASNEIEEDEEEDIDMV